MGTLELLLFLALVGNQMFFNIHLLPRLNKMDDRLRVLEDFFQSLKEELEDGSIPNKTMKPSSTAEVWYG